ncbi:MAG: response regulator [Bacteroidia bacterium]
MYTDKKFKIVLIDDDPSMMVMLKDFITEKYTRADVAVFKTGEEALSGIFTMPEVIVLDYHLDSVEPDALNGLQILKNVKDLYPETPVIFLSVEEKPEVAMNTINYGAYDYIVKNENAFHRLEILLANILTQSELKRNLSSQKFFNRLLAILLIAVVIGFVIFKMLG